MTRFLCRLFGHSVMRTGEIAVQCARCQRWLLDRDALRLDIDRRVEEIFRLYLGKETR